MKPRLFNSIKCYQDNINNNNINAQDPRDDKCLIYYVIRP